jgi:hypothetical protein
MTSVERMGVMHFVFIFDNRMSLPAYLGKNKYERQGEWDFTNPSYRKGCDGHGRSNERLGLVILFNVINMAMLNAGKHSQR